MSRTSSQAVLTIFIPDGHEVDPQAWQELQRHVRDEYGAEAVLDAVAGLGAQLRPLLTGDWGQHHQADVRADLAPLVARAFFTLDWLDVD